MCDSNVIEIWIYGHETRIIKTLSCVIQSDGKMGNQPCSAIQGLLWWILKSIKWNREDIGKVDELIDKKNTKR